MPKSVRAIAILLCCLFCAAPLAHAAVPVSPDDAPRADATVLRALNSGAESVKVLIGVRDGTPSLRLLAAHPDPAGEPDRRVRRLQAQDALVRAFPSTFRAKRRYESFSILAGEATREAVMGLANRADVEWVTLDGVRQMQQAAPQAAQTLIHSDQANALGFTGAGQSIAILDTGVDYNVSELGGGPIPNAKVVAGKDFGDNDEDPLDCEGHGTSVAAVAAGPTGVAPDATIVALKVVKGTECDMADDSDILAAINYAITQQATYNITTINLSFGGAPTDGLPHAVLRRRLPRLLSAIDAANAAGIVFVTSAGNDALDNAIAVPACVSNAVSVGAVYPNSVTDVEWDNGSGGTLCRGLGRHAGHDRLLLGLRHQSVAARSRRVLDRRAEGRRNGLLPRHLRLLPGRRRRRDARAPGPSRPESRRHREPPEDDRPFVDGSAQRHRDAPHRHARRGEPTAQHVRRLPRRPRHDPRRHRIGHGDRHGFGLQRHAGQRLRPGGARARRPAPAPRDADGTRRHDHHPPRPHGRRAGADQRGLRQDRRLGAVPRPLPGQAGQRRLDADGLGHGLADGREHPRLRGADGPGAAHLRDSTGSRERSRPDGRPRPGHEVLPVRRPRPQSGSRGPATLPLLRRAGPGGIAGGQGQRTGVGGPRARHQRSGRLDLRLLGLDR